MAKFLKIPLTGVANTPEQLISIDQVVSVVPGDTAGPGGNPTTTTRIFLNAAAAFDTVQITHTAALTAGDVLAAFNAALTANPGGVVSTLGSPIATAQVPQQPSIGGAQGRTVVTAQAVFVTYTAVAFS
mgnify:FL=1|jgi:hypothetical protein|tara:strand:+ start:69 stop:455 length:387 start_codon:yes stop_codon:yes gene_type:complete